MTLCAGPRGSQLTRRAEVMVNPGVQLIDVPEPVEVFDGVSR